MYMLSWKNVVKIVNHTTRMQGCHTGCEQVHGIHICGLFKKYPTCFYSAETNEAREVRCGREMEGTFMSMHGFFPAIRQRQACAASM
jgi:hypothetical protein